MFPGPVGVKIQEVTDGTSNTILVVDAPDARAVEWTKPDDWDVGDAPRAADLLGKFPGGLPASFTDGSVRMISGKVADAVFKALLTRNGGEVIPRDAF